MERHSKIDLVCQTMKSAVGSTGLHFIVWQLTAINRKELGKRSNKQEESKGKPQQIGKTQNNPSSRKSNSTPHTSCSLCLRGKEIISLWWMHTGIWFLFDDVKFFAVIFLPKQRQKLFTNVPEACFYIFVWWIWMCLFRHVH